MFWERGTVHIKYICMDGECWCWFGNNFHFNLWGNARFSKLCRQIIIARVACAVVIRTNGNQSWGLSEWRPSAGRDAIFGGWKCCIVILIAIMFGFNSSLPCLCAQTISTDAAFFLGQFVVDINFMCAVMGTRKVVSSLLSDQITRSVSQLCFLFLHNSH